MVCHAPSIKEDRNGKALLFALHTAPLSHKCAAPPFTGNKVRFVDSNILSLLITIGTYELSGEESSVSKTQKMQYFHNRSRPSKSAKRKEEERNMGICCGYQEKVF